MAANSPPRNISTRMAPASTGPLPGQAKRRLTSRSKRDEAFSCDGLLKTVRSRPASVGTHGFDQGDRSGAGATCSVATPSPVGESVCAGDKVDGCPDMWTPFHQEQAVCGCCRACGPCGQCASATINENDIKHDVCPSASPAYPQAGGVRATNRHCQHLI